jgi:carbamoyltransferase
MYLGVAKTLYNSSACLIRAASSGPEVEVILSERVSRKKSCGSWPDKALLALKATESPTDLLIAENRDVLNSLSYEEVLNSRLPFYEYLKARGLERFSRHFNPSIEFLTHHYCHAMGAVMMSPFSRCLIFVMDGAGTNSQDFFGDHPEIQSYPPSGPMATAGAYEEMSAYLHDAGKLRCVFKRWRIFTKGQRSGKVLSESLGIFYEDVARYIFNCNRSSGKVMGLAPFGEAVSLTGSRIEFLDGLDWSLAFTGSGKNAWQTNDRFSHYARLASSAQREFEDDVSNTLTKLRQQFPDYDRLILTGGCSLNCTLNGKLARSRLFDEIYVPPAPGDEGISLGCASHLYFAHAKNSWLPFEHDRQNGYFGAHANVPTEERIREVFGDFTLLKPDSIADFTADILNEGHVVAWYQGRSESGPRALGNRSILARPDRAGIKDYLNNRIKFRESFRPYGASCVHEKSHEYFEVPKGFNTPYMAFAAPTRFEFRERLGEITHVDGTCRFQSVRQRQNPLFHELLQAFGRKTGLFCLLNTSLNVMGEPIVESLEDAREFLRKVPVHGLAIGEFYIRGKGAQDV